MVALNFKKQFAPAILSGEKTGTIRAPRRDGRPVAVPGRPLTLYTGMRTKGCRKIRETVCLSVQPVLIRDALTIYVNRVLLIAPSAFARADGFPSLDELIAFFESTHGLPFEGFLVKWPAPDDSMAER